MKPSDLSPTSHKLGRLKRVLWVIGVVLLVVGAGFIPVSDKLAKAGDIQVKVFPSNHPMPQAFVTWHDLGLNPEFQGDWIRLNERGQGHHDDLVISTVLWKLALKRILVPLDKWSGCKHCDGPWVSYGISPSAKSPLPANKRLVSHQTTSLQGVLIEARWITDERNFEEQSVPDFEVSLMLKEAAELVAKGNTPEIPTDSLGPVLSSVRPVRVAVEQQVVIVFMGGKRGFILNPKEATCPALNGFMIGGANPRHEQMFDFERVF